MVSATKTLSTIVVVDDSRVMHSMYDLILKRYEKCRVVHAMSGEEALDLIKTTRDFQLIILDIDMPGMGGLEFMKHYMGRCAGPGAPVVVVSSEGKEEDRRGLEWGAAAALAKPFLPVDLHDIIDKLMGIRVR